MRAGVRRSESVLIRARPGKKGGEQNRHSTPDLDRTRCGRLTLALMSVESTAPAVTMDAIVALAKRRGFIFQSSEIYGGLNGFFDYGPLGAELKKNIRDCWWDDMVRRRDDIVGIETSIIMHPKVWQASGHVAGFTDPLVDCKISKQRYRADQLFFAPVEISEVEITASGPEAGIRSNSKIVGY